MCSRSSAAELHADTFPFLEKKSPHFFFSDLSSLSCLCWSLAKIYQQLNSDKFLRYSLRMTKFSTQAYISVMLSEAKHLAKGTQIILKLNNALTSLTGVQLSSLPPFTGAELSSVPPHSRPRL